MSKGFDNKAVGLPQLYAQIRGNTVPNLAAQTGLIIDTPAAVAPVVGLVNSFRVRLTVRAYGADRPPVRISYATATVAAFLASVTVNAGGGTVRGVSAVTLAATVGAEIIATPDPTTGLVDITVGCTAPVPADGLLALVQVLNESIEAAVTVT